MKMKFALILCLMSSSSYGDEPLVDRKVTLSAAAAVPGAVVAYKGVEKWRNANDNYGSVMQRTTDLIDKTRAPLYDFRRQILELQGEAAKLLSEIIALKQNPYNGELEYDSNVESKQYQVKRRIDSLLAVLKKIPGTESLQEEINTRGREIDSADFKKLAFKVDDWLRSNVTKEGLQKLLESTVDEHAGLMARVNSAAELPELKIDARVAAEAFRNAALRQRAVGMGITGGGVLIAAGGAALAAWNLYASEQPENLPPVKEVSFAAE